MAVSEAIVQVIFQGRILETIKLNKNIATVGRLPDNDIVINNLGVSRRHCRIICDDSGGFYIEDLESANGTVVNGIRVARSPLYNGDEVQIGKHKLVFQITSKGVAGFFKADEDRGPDLWVGDRTVFTGMKKPGTPHPPKILPPQPVPSEKGEDTLPNFQAELEGKTFGIKIIFDGKVADIKGLGLEEVKIGRDPVNDIVINNLAVGLRHARIIHHDNQYVIEDLGSANGIRVNGVSVKRSPLYPGDEILVGKHTLVFNSSEQLLASIASADIETVSRPTELTTPEAVVTEVPGQAGSEPAPETGEKKSPREGKYAVRVELDGRSVADYALMKRVTCIGRLAENDIAVDNIGVSRLHAKIVIEDDDQVYIEDQDSANGILVNGLPLKRSPLYPGDVVQIVKHKLIFELAGKTQPERSAAGGKMTTEAWRMDSTFMVTDVDRKRLLKEWVERAEREKKEKAESADTQPAAISSVEPPAIESAPIMPESAENIPADNPASEPEIEATPALPSPAVSQPPPPEPPPKTAGLFYEPTPILGVTSAIAKLVLPDGSERRIDYDIFVIGKDERANVKIAGTFIKDRHAIIKREGGNIWSITDQGRLTRVKVNGKTVRSTILKPSDEISIGNLRCTFVVISNPS